MRCPAFLLAIAAAFSSGCWHARYLAQQGAGQLRLMRERRRITDVLRDPSVDAETKRRLRLAVEARAFGVNVLGLRGGDAYTRYVDTHGEPVAWNVSAAPKDQLKPYLVRFPIAGAVPYLGFFREADARTEKARLEAMDLDTELRGVAGYSTLGITSDPIYSSMLEGGDARIVEVTLHEMLHGTMYLPGHSDWNESIATFVGVRGAAAFFQARGRGDEAARVVEESRALELQQERFAKFIEPFVRELEALYASPRSRAEKLELREKIFERIGEAFTKEFPPRPGQKPGRLARGAINNAVMVGYAVYHRATPEHRRIWKRLGGDLPALVALVRLYKHAVEEHRDPIKYLSEWGRN